MPKSRSQKSRKQVAFLLSKGSPLSEGQQSELKGELHTGEVKVKRGSKHGSGHRGK